MTKAYPFASGEGQSVNEREWRNMAGLFANTGVVPGVGGELQVTADASGVSVTVNTGRAFIQGHVLDIDAQVPIPIKLPLANKRIDAICAEVDMQNRAGGITMVVGTEDTAPLPPPIVQTPDVRWQIPLAYVHVDTTGITKVDDARWPVRGQWVLSTSTTTTAPSGTDTTIQFDALAEGMGVSVPLTAFPIRVGGIYGITARVQWGVQLSNAMAKIVVNRGGTVVHQVPMRANEFWVAVSTVLMLQGGDTVELRVNQFSGSDQTVDYAQLIVTRI